MGLNRTDLWEMYKLMLFTRIFEEKASIWYKQGLIKEAPHQCIGQEAIGVGFGYSLETNDQVLPSLRTRSVFWAKGVSIEQILLAMAGKKRSPSKGHETSHHAAFPDLGILFGTGMVGSSISIGVGAALAFKMKKKKNVVVIFFGDGASNRGEFHEALNLAAIWDLPAIFVCENNQVALSTEIKNSMRIDKIATRAQGYGIPGVTVDGSDITEVQKAAQDSIRRAKSGEGPSLVECVVSRFCPHVSFLEDNRSEQLVSKLREEYDPLKKSEQIMLEKGFNQAEFGEMRERINEDLDSAIKMLENEPDPVIEDILAHVYATEEG